MSLLLLLTSTTPGGPSIINDHFILLPYIGPSRTRKPRPWPIAPTRVRTRWRPVWGMKPHAILPIWEGAGDTARDVSGQFHSAVAPSASATPVWSFGRSGPCLSFDETDDRLDIPNFVYEDNQATVTPELTFAFFFLITDNTGAAFQYLLSQGVLGSSDTINFYIREDSASDPGEVTCQFRLTGAGAATTLLSVGVVNDGVWHSIVLTIDRLNNVRFYLDGTQRASSLPAAGTGGFNPSADLRIGANNLAGGGTSSDRFFGGFMDFVGIFRGAWSPELINQWHTDSMGLLYPGSQLVTGRVAPPSSTRMTPEQLGLSQLTGVY